MRGPVTVYVSLPLSGPAAADGRDAADGARLALRRARRRAGGLEVRARYLDDAAPGRRWDPAAVGRNARAAAQDSATAAYIGELDSEPTRASMPIVNDAGIAQVSPGATAVDLTAPAPGYPGSPELYRPSGEATFARVVPDDGTVLAAVAERAAGSGLGAVATAFGDTPFGLASRQRFEAHAEEVGVEVVGPGDAEASVGADERGYVLRDADGAEGFAAPLAPSELPDAGFAREFRRRFGRDPGPYAAYGYEAMRVVLAAVGGADRADGFRASVVEGMLGSEHPDSVLGPFSITPGGDTTLCAVQRYAAGPWRRPGAAICPG